MIKKLFVLGCCALLSFKGQSQDLLVSYQAEDKPLIRILKDLEKEYDIYFAFSDDQIRGKFSSIDVTNRPLPTVLQDLLRPHQLVYEFVESKFIAVNRPESVFIRAQVTDEENNETLPFAIVRLKGTNKGIITDKDGNFNLVIDKPLGAILEISFLGYVTQELPIENYKNSDRLLLKMKPAPQQLDEVVVKEYLNYGIVTDDKASKIKVHPQEMEVLPGLSERDILLTAQLLPGISSINETAGGINIRGSSIDNTHIYWNNIPIYHPAHYFGNISSFIPSTVEEVDVYKNYIPVTYGGSSAGMILANSPDEIEEQAQYETNLNLTHGDIFARFPVHKNGNLMIGARRSFNDWLATPTFRAYSDKLFDGTLTQNVQEDLSEEFEYNSKLAFTDVAFSYAYELSGKQKISLNGLRSSSVLNYQSEEEFEDESAESIQNHDVTNYGLNFQWQSRWADRYYTKLSASFADYEMRYTLENRRTEGDESDDDAQQRTNDLRNLEIRFTNQLAIGNSGTLQFGAQANRLTTALVIGERFFLEEDFNEVIDSEGWVSGYFVDYLNKLGAFDIGLAFRFNQFHISEETSFEPQFRLNYHINDHWLLKSTWGRYTQYLTALQELEFNFSNTVERHWIIADDEEFVPISSNEQLVIGTLFSKGGWLVDLELYNKNLDGQIARNLGPGFDDDDGFSQGTERVQGVDIMVRKKWRNYKIWGSYSFQDSQAELPDLEQDNFPSILNIRHQFQLSQTFTFGQFDISSGYTIRSGTPYTAASELLFITESEDRDEEEFEPFYEIEFEELNANRLPVYQRIDVSAWYKFPKYPKSKLRGELGVSILNVLNRENIFSRTFAVEEFDEDVIGIETQEHFLLGFTPNISLRLKF